MNCILCRTPAAAYAFGTGKHGWPAGIRVAMCGAHLTTALDAGAVDLERPAEPAATPTPPAERRSIFGAACFVIAVVCFFAVWKLA